jgi:DNA-binding NarL/FixJ family response regulator
MITAWWPKASKLCSPTTSSSLGVVEDGRAMIEAAEKLRPDVIVADISMPKLLAEGRSAKEIANELAISPRTVEFHKYQMMEMNGLRNSAELIHFAIKRGIATI